MSRKFERDISNRTSGNKARATATAMAIGAWSNIDYVAVIASGEALHATGVSLPLSAGLAAGLGTAETLATSYLATKGMGDFTFNAKSNIGKKISSMSPAISLWRGAGTGVMIDKSNHREVTFRRRMVHSVPYGVALGAWVAVPVTDVAEYVVGVGSDTYNATSETIADNPPEAMGIAAVIGATVTALAVQKFRNRN